MREASLLRCFGLAIMQGTTLTIQHIMDKIETLDTTKTGVAAYLTDAGTSLKTSPASGAAHRLAVFRFIADTFKMSGEIRQQAWKQFNATHSSFGCNASAARQNVLGLKAAEAAQYVEIEA